MSARSRELFALIPVGLLVTAGFTAVLIVESEQIGDLSFIYGLYFLGLCLATHFVIRARLPDADPFLFPLVALLAPLGGALAAWLFPPTDTEDRLMGETRDWMLQELNATLRSEVASASALAKGLSSALGQDIRRVDATLRPEHAWSGAGVRH